jgi:hypothetical protein
MEVLQRTGEYYGLRNTVVHGCDAAYWHRLFSLTGEYSMTPKRLEQFKALASQLTLGQQCGASIDAIEYYRECIMDGMTHKAAQAAAERHQFKMVREMVNDLHSSRML